MSILQVVVASPISRAAEFKLTGRLVYAALLGAAVAQERSTGKPHPSAGVRTMALVALGAATFTLCSLYGFTSAAGGTIRAAWLRMWPPVSVSLERESLRRRQVERAKQARTERVRWSTVPAASHPANANESSFQIILRLLKNRTM